MLFRALAIDSPPRRVAAAPECCGEAAGSGRRMAYSTFTFAAAMTLA